MAVQSLGVGTSANDGSGDTLRAAGAKINDNFSEIYTKLGDASALSSGISATATVVTLTAPTITGVVAGTQTSATITTLATTTVNGTTLNGGTCAVAAGSITDSSGAISFGDENLSTTGTLASGVLTAASGSTVGNLTLANGSITDSGGAISFGDENLSTTGTFSSGNLTCGTITSTGSSIVFEGSTPDANETTITVVDPTADRTITIPNETGTMLTTGASNAVTGNMMKSSSTLLIVDSSGSTLKTVIGAGSAS